MGMLRAFIASEVPTAIQDAIGVASSGLRARSNAGLVRWVPLRNIHLTLKFLGDVSVSSLELIRKMLATEAPKYPAFDLVVEGLGAYPNVRRPRIVWAGVTAPDELRLLQAGIEAAAVRLGYASEDRAYSPHLTIGRVRRNPSTTDLGALAGELASSRAGTLGRLRVDAIHVFRSDLHPTGAVYTKLFGARLDAT